jgi:hypothetical protein
VIEVRFPGGPSIIGAIGFNVGLADVWISSSYRFKRGDVVGVVV